MRRKDEESGRVVKGDGGRGEGRRDDGDGNKRVGEDETARERVCRSDESIWPEAHVLIAANKGTEHQVIAPWLALHFCTHMMQA